jgi:HEAT repeat protein
MTDRTPPPPPGEPVTASKQVHTWRPMKMWACGILLALALTWVISARVVPFLQVRSKIEVAANGGIYLTNPWVRVEELGGPERAVPKLALYLRLPEGIARGRWAAVDMLGHCGQSAEPVLLRLISDSDAGVRRHAARALQEMGSRSREVIQALVEALDDPDNDVSDAAAEVLGTLGPEAATAIPALEGTSRRRHCTEANKAVGLLRGETRRQLMGRDLRYLKKWAARKMRATSRQGGGGR